MFEDVLILKKGGIHIKKKNRGKFTEYCGGKVTEECIAKGKKSKDPKIRKRATFAANSRRWKHENGGILKYQNPAGPLLESKDTLNTSYLAFKRTLPDNLRLTPEKDYHMYDYWKLNGEPKNFREGKRRGMFTWDRSDKGYHAGSIAEDRNTGIYHFMKPKHHPTVKYELDWFNKGLQTLEGGKQVPVEGKDKEFWEDFTSKYQLDTTGVDYQYVPIKKNGGILKAQGGAKNPYAPDALSPIGIALNQAKAMAKMKGEQHLPPGVKEVVGPDGKKVAIRTEQPLVPLEQSIAEWLPGTGDVAEVGYIADDVKNGNYGSAALATAMIALPGNVGKVLRKSDIPTSKLTEAERLGIPKGERNQPGKPRSPRAVEYDIVDGRPTKEFLDDYHAYVEALKTGGRRVDITDMFDSSWYRQRLLNQGLTEEQANQLILRLKDRVSPENLVVVDGLNSVRNFRRVEDGIPIEMTPERLTEFGRHTTGPGLSGKSLISLTTKADPEEIILHEIGGHRSQPLVADFNDTYLDQSLTNLGLQRHMKIGKTADYGLNWGEVRARALTIAKQMSDAGWNPNSPEQVNVWLNKHIFTNSPKNANQGALYYDRPRFIKAVSEGLKNGGKL